MKKCQLELPGRLTWQVTGLEDAEKWALRLMVHDLEDTFIHQFDQKANSWAVLKHLHKNGHTCVHCGQVGQVVEVQRLDTGIVERLFCRACGKGL